MADVSLALKIIVCPVILLLQLITWQPAVSVLTYILLQWTNRMPRLFGIPPVSIHCRHYILENLTQMSVIISADIP